MEILAATREPLEAKSIRRRLTRILVEARAAARMSTAGESVDGDLRLRVHSLRYLAMAIEDALKRQSQGVYGRCATCDVMIPAERLRVVPFAIRCLHCQREYEICHVDELPSLDRASAPAS
jgi:DnaK suppressor protein